MFGIDEALEDLFNPCKTLKKEMIKDETSKTSKEVDSEAEEKDQQRLGTDMNYKFKRRHWTVYFFFITWHIGALFGLYYCFIGAKLGTIIWAAVLAILNIQAVALAAHHAYSHRSFKPRKALKLTLIFFQTMAGQNSILRWARDHRVHHKYMSTDADPYNASRGFFFAHSGWLLVEKHPQVIEKSKVIDLSDLFEDDWIMFQRKYFDELYFIIGFLFPMLIPYFLWDEDRWISYNVAFCLRYVIVLHTVSTINSFGHTYEIRLFDKTIIHWATGDNEFGCGKGLSTWFIEFMAKYGYAYDLKNASNSIVIAHSALHGDGSQKIK